MSHRSKNLLEAFNDSSQAEKNHAEETAKSRPFLAGLPAKARALTSAKSPPLAKVGGPFAGPVSDQGAPPKQASPTAPARPGSENPGMDAFLRNALPVYVAIALVFFVIGRASVSKVAAAGESADGGQQSGQESIAALGAMPGKGAGPTSEADASSGSPGETAPPASNPRPVEAGDLYDRSNKCTILAAQYAKTDAAKDLGWNAYSHLKKEGFKVFPLHGGQRRYQLFVEASKLSGELDETLAEIRRLPGPNGRKDDFASAMVVMIDTYVNRD